MSGENLNTVRAEKRGPTLLPFLPPEFSPMHVGHPPHDLSSPEGVEAVIGAVDAEGDDMFEGCAKHPLA
jgi:hypothetical protein